jgi:large subunit ribosomal protein L33
MINKKSSRILITLECEKCRLNLNKRKFGVSHYITSKNRKNTPKILNIFKFCKYCNKHVLHKELK